MSVPQNRSYKKSRGCFWNELPGLPMTVQTDSLGRLKFWWDVIKKNTLLFEELRVLQKRVSEEQAAQVVVEEELITLKGSVSAFDEFSEKLTRSDKALEAARAEVASLKEEVMRADM